MRYVTGLLNYTHATDLRSIVLGDLVWAHKECEQMFAGVADIVVCNRRWLCPKYDRPQLDWDLGDGLAGQSALPREPKARREV